MTRQSLLHLTNLGDGKTILNEIYFFGDKREKTKGVSSFSPVWWLVYLTSWPFVPKTVQLLNLLRADQALGDCCAVSNLTMVIFISHNSHWLIGNTLHWKWESFADGFPFPEPLLGRNVMQVKWNLIAPFSLFCVCSFHGHRGIVVPVSQVIWYTNLHETISI